MDESELDEWFEVERDKLEDAFTTALLDTKRDSAKAKLDFDRRYRALIAEFQHRQHKLYSQQLRAAALRKPITRIKDSTQLFFFRIGSWWTMRKEAFKKWRFERKFRRLLQDKSDMY